MSTTILAIESSCDDTSAAVIRDGIILSNVVAGQEVHMKYGGVVPELASRAHQKNILPTVATAICLAGIEKREIDAVAYTSGPGLLGSLLVGVSFAKGFASSLSVPMIAVNHLKAHVLARFIRTSADGVTDPPDFPFLSLLVSGGNTQIIKVTGYDDMEVIGQTIDDAAGEAFDKCAKAIGLPYPGGPVVDRLSSGGDPAAFAFSRPNVAGYDYSFSGLKTSFLYTVRDYLKTDPDFIAHNKASLCASLQQAVVDTLMKKLIKASRDLGITSLSLAGGVSANTSL
ncbi:MAG: tRNA (adenosine(37)-N6)-threonylcarbamoyltransferase complex transferase subunit TsaD, partial [Tannerellaceae bacterium]|nr:tRNA (adenosine(37)-N6)-threonylcarbamoyltransferase complex transferase subunit TsaD [Tannerellaceae bacterium]